MGTISRGGQGVRTYWPIHNSWCETWIACKFPERPYEEGATGYHYGCHACDVAAHAAYLQISPLVQQWFDVCWKQELRRKRPEVST